MIWVETEINTDKKNHNHEPLIFNGDASFLNDLKQFKVTCFNAIKGKEMFIMPVAAIGEKCVTKFFIISSKILTK